PDLNHNGGFKGRKPKEQVWMPKEVTMQIPSEKEVAESCKVIPLHLPKKGHTEESWK
ncbi:hypothetical protein HAX54_022522, partial [Datura stramonium]|nr:hypothetical protein [Datura stramonium]